MALQNIQKITALVLFTQDSIKENLLQNLGIFVLTFATLFTLYKAKLQLMATVFVTMEHKVLQNNHLIKKREITLLFMRLTI